MKRANFAASFAVVAATIASPAARADDASPKDVYLAYTAALREGDVDAAKKRAIADAQRMPLLEGRRDAAAAEKQFRAAVDKAFPGALKPVAYPGPTTWPDEAPQPERLTVADDTATYVTRDAMEPIKFRRVNGAWKVDLNAMYPAKRVSEVVTFRSALVEVMNALTAEMAAGRFKNYADVQADLETRVKMRIANPDQPATTRPK